MQWQGCGAAGPRPPSSGPASARIASRAGPPGACQTGSVPPTQYAHADGLLIALGALIVIMLLCRWVFSTSDRDQRTAQRLAKARARGDYGLLVPVATVSTGEDAELLRRVLRAAGIRGTVAAGEELGTHVVLVFRADSERARALVAG